MHTVTATTQPQLRSSNSKREENKTPNRCCFLFSCILLSRSRTLLLCLLCLYFFFLCQEQERNIGAKNKTWTHSKSSRRKKGVFNPHWKTQSDYTIRLLTDRFSRSSSWWRLCSYVDDFILASFSLPSHICFTEWISTQRENKPFLLFLCQTYETICQSGRYHGQERASVWMCVTSSCHDLPVWSAPASRGSANSSQIAFFFLSLNVCYIFWKSTILSSRLLLCFVFILCFFFSPYITRRFRVDLRCRRANLARLLLPFILPGFCALPPTAPPR